jgi:hypothetical protein
MRTDQGFSGSEVLRWSINPAAPAYHPQHPIPHPGHADRCNRVWQFSGFGGSSEAVMSRTNAEGWRMGASCMPPRTP